jgi:prepilin-type processing-associated H-X9-DG protein
MHKTGINAGYFDGHAESIKHERIMEIQNSPQLIDRYFNPFK